MNPNMGLRPACDENGITCSVIEDSDSIRREMRTRANWTKMIQSKKKGENLTAVNVFLQVVRHSTSCVVELKKESDSHQRSVLLDVLGDVHLRFVSQHMGSQLKKAKSSITRQIKNKKITSK